MSDCLQEMVMKLRGWLFSRSIIVGASRMLAPVNICFVVWATAELLGSPCSFQSYRGQGSRPARVPSFLANNKTSLTTSQPLTTTFLSTRLTRLRCEVNCPSPGWLDVLLQGYDQHRSAFSAAPSKSAPRRPPNRLGPVVTLSVRRHKGSGTQQVRLGHEMACYRWWNGN